MLDTWVPLTPSLGSPMCPICPPWKQIPENAGSTLGKAGGNPGNIGGIPTLIGLGFCPLVPGTLENAFLRSPFLYYFPLRPSPFFSRRWSHQLGRRQTLQQPPSQVPSSQPFLTASTLRMPLPPSLFRAPSLPGYPVQWV